MTNTSSAHALQHRVHSSKHTLAAMRTTGEGIKAARKRLRFEKERFEDHLATLPFNRSWSFRLVKLATYFDEIVAAIEALPADKQDWSLDGALATFRDAKRTPEQRAGHAIKAATRRRAKLLDELAELDAGYPQHRAIL